MDVAIYRTAGDRKGEIVCHIGNVRLDFLEDSLPLYGDDTAYVESDVVNGEMSYVEVGSEQVKPRPSMQAGASKTTIAADGVDEASITGLPTPATLSINDGASQTVPTGQVTLASNRPGTFNIVVQAWPHLDWSTTVEAI